MNAMDQLEREVAALRREVRALQHLIRLIAEVLGIHLPREGENGR